MPQGAKMDGGLTKAGGFHVSKCCALALGAVLALLLAGMVAATYYLAPCPCRASTRAASTARPKSSSYVRLPTSVVPHSYDVSIIPFLWEDNFTFIGSVHILVNVTLPTYNITIHSADLEISETNVTRIVSEVVSDSSERPMTIRYTNYDGDREFYVLHMYDRLETAQYRVSMKYKAKLSDALKGVYRSSYVVGNTTR